MMWLAIVKRMCNHLMPFILNAICVESEIRGFQGKDE
jgi:hypothetical protein